MFVLFGLASKVHFSGLMALDAGSSYLTLPFDISLLESVVTPILFLLENFGI